MPSISFSYSDLCSLIGKKIEIEEIARLLTYAKAELDSYDEETDEIFVSCGDTNLPYLWSVEGIARFIKGILELQKGIPHIEIFKKSEYKINVAPELKQIRPFIAAFVATGCKVNDYLIKQLIALQEKFCDNYGRRRQKAAIGIYNCSKISFPIDYKAVLPESVKFTPLESSREMNLKEILEEHPAGKKYSHLLNEFKLFPLLTDSNRNVLSFPPIINSDWSGKVNIGDENLFFEATGTDLDSVLLAANIFAQVFFERGFKLHAVDILYPEGEKITTPFLFNESVKISALQVKTLTGLDLDEEQIKSLLEKMQYEWKNSRVRIPDYRRDIMHPVDIIEDIAIAYGYDNIEALHTKAYTSGKTFPILKLIDNCREIISGLGYQETFSAILSNKQDLYEKMDAKDLGTVEIKEFISERFSAVRTWIMPVLMNILSQNKHADYPQKIFEEGIAVVRNKNIITDKNKLAALTIHSNANYTESRQALDSLLSSLGIEFRIVEEKHSSFIPGRMGIIVVNEKEIGIIGEISPKVISNFDLTLPVAGFEIDLTELFNIIKK